MKWLLFFLIAFTGYVTTGQSFEQPVRFLGLGLTMQSYKGDLASYESFSGSFQGSLLFNKKEKWNGGINLSIGSVSGQQVSGVPMGGTPQPNTFFKTSLVSFHYDLRYNFIRKEKLKVYASLGFGLARFNPKDEEDNNLQDLLNTRATDETYGNITAMMPIQVGAMYFLTNDYGFNFQIGLMNIFTDYLDNISTLGTESGGDNVLQIKFAMLVPLRSNLIQSD